MPQELEKASTKKDVDLEKLIITQANALIEAAYKMTLQEKRLMSLLISFVRQGDESFKDYKIPISQIVTLLGLENNKDFYRRIRNITRTLLGRVLDVNLDGEEWVQFQWVSRARYISKAKSEIGEACIELKIHEDLEPLLLALTKNFSSIPFKAIISIPSQHSLRILEILHNRSQRIRKGSFYISLDDLKHKLGIDKMYPNFKDFRRRILEKAELDCKQNGHIYFTYELKKKGKKVVGFYFTIFSNPNFNQRSDKALPKQIQIFELPQPKSRKQSPTKKSKIPSQYETLINELNKMGYIGNGLELIENIGEQAVKDLLNLAKKQEKNSKGTGKEIKNMGGLINWLVQNEAWKVEAKERAIKEEAEKRAKEARLQAKRSKKVAELIESINSDYSYAYRDYLDKYWQTTLSEEEREWVKKDIELNGNKFAVGWLDKHGWDEEEMFFTTERDPALERLKLAPELPDYLSSKENYLRSQPNYQNTDPEIIKEVITALEN